MAKRNLETIAEQWNQSESFPEFCRRIRCDRHRGLSLIGMVRKAGFTLKELDTRATWTQPEYVDLYESVGYGEPTGAEPGSPEKVEVLRERASKYQELFHPHDCKGIRKTKDEQ